MACIRGFGSAQPPGCKNDGAFDSAQAPLLYPLNNYTCGLLLIH